MICPCRFAIEHSGGIVVHIRLAIVLWRAYSRERNISGPADSQEVLMILRQHLREMHQTHSVLPWRRCERYEDMQSEYAQSIAYNLEECPRFRDRKPVM